MNPEIMESVCGLKTQYLQNISMTASRINSRNASMFRETERNLEFVLTFLKRKLYVEGVTDPELMKWIDNSEKIKHEAGLNFWYEMHKGIQESLKEF